MISRGVVAFARPGPVFPWPLGAKRRCSCSARTNTWVLYLENGLAVLAMPIDHAYLSWSTILVIASPLPSKLELTSDTMHPAAHESSKCSTKVLVGLQRRYIILADALDLFPSWSASVALSLLRSSSSSLSQTHNQSHGSPSSRRQTHVQLNVFCWLE